MEHRRQPPPASMLSQPGRCCCSGASSGSPRWRRLRSHHRAAGTATWNTSPCSLTVKSASPSAAAHRGASHHHHTAALSRLHAPLLFEHLGQFRSLEDREGREVVYDFGEISHLSVTLTFGFGFRFELGSSGPRTGRRSTPRRAGPRRGGRPGVAAY